MFLHEIIQSALVNMRQETHLLHKGEEVIVEGQSGSVVGDEELLADKSLGEIATNTLARFGDIKTVVGEGWGSHEGRKNGSLIAYVDPLDASLYYKTRGNVRQFFPYAGVVTLVRDGPEPTFSDIVSAGIINYPSGDIWLSTYFHDDNGVTLFPTNVTTLNHEPARPYQGEFSLTKIPVIAEMYYRENRERVVKAFSDQDGYLRSPGCAALEMASVASGQSAAFICISQKAHELGAGYHLVKNAGGVVVDWAGKSYDDVPYDFNRKYPVILAGNQAIADEIVKRLNA